MALSAGAHVTDNIRLVRMLGKGGMGSVWIAQHLTLDLEVAVKFISAELLQDGDPIVLTRFRREAQLAAKLDSQHVVRTLDHGVTDDGTPYIVMELLRGESLADKISRDRRVGVHDAARIVSEVAAGLAVAHAEGIVHRDIKPHNVFLARGPGKPEIAKVLDFGVAKGTTNDAQPLNTSSGVLIGTPQYMSPEQLMRAGPVDATADLWALSVTAYEMLVGKLPFRGATLAATLIAITRADLEPPSSVDTSLPTALDAWFKRALAIDPDRRFATALELAEAFKAAIAGVATGEVARSVIYNKDAPTTQSDSSATAEFVAARSLDLPLSQREPAFAPTQPVSVLDTPRSAADESSQPIPLVGKGKASADASSVKTAQSPGAEPKPGERSDAPDADQVDADQVDADDDSKAKTQAAEISTQTALVSGESVETSRASIDGKKPLDRASTTSGSRNRIAVLGGIAALGLVGFFVWRTSTTPSRGPIGAASASSGATSSAGVVLDLPSAQTSAAQPSASVSQPPLSTIPKTSIGAGYAPASRVWLPDYAIAREVGDENASFMEAQSACERRAMSLCSDAQWARACESHPEIAQRPSWTVTAAESGVIVRGGNAGDASAQSYGFGGSADCTHRAVTDPTTRSTERIGLCCTRSVGISSTVDNAAFLKVTSGKLVEYETAYNSGNGDRIVAMMEDPTEFHGKKLAHDDLEAAAVWMSKQGRLIHDVCDVSIEKKDEQTTWTADCSVLIDGPAGLFRGVRRYISGGDHGLIEVVREPRSPVKLGPTTPPH